MWSSLREIAKRESCKIHDICSLIQLRKNPRTSLTAAIRVFLMLYYRAASTEDGHVKAGHGNFQQMMNRARMNCETLDSLKAQGRESKTQKEQGASCGDIDEDSDDERDTANAEISAMPKAGLPNYGMRDTEQRVAGY